MIELTDEMRQAFADAAGWPPAPWMFGPDVERGITAVLSLVERKLRAEIAYRIRAELVCCDVFEKTHDTAAWERASSGPHAICYWSEAAARLAEVDAPSASDQRFEVVTWDYREQPDQQSLAAAISRVSGGRVHAVWPETGDDQYALVLSDRPLTAEQAAAVYRNPPQ